MLVPIAPNATDADYYLYYGNASPSPAPNSPGAVFDFYDPMSSATLSSSWASFYPFTKGAQDVSNNFNGTLKNGASIVNDSVRGNVLNLLPLAGEYVSLPAGAGNAQTISGWVKWSGGNAWQRIFDLGQSENNFFYLTAADNTGYPQSAITPDLAVYNQVIESPVALPVNQWVPFAVVMNGREGILYLNGTAVAISRALVALLENGQQADGSVVVPERISRLTVVQSEGRLT